MVNRSPERSDNFQQNNQASLDLSNLRTIQEPLSILDEARPILGEFLRNHVAQRLGNLDTVLARLSGYQKGIRCARRAWRSEAKTGWSPWPWPR
jgi:hypothetical protein